MTAFTAFAFEDNIENGGEAVKLGIFRAQSYKVVERKLREGLRQEDGTLRMNGPINEKKTIYTLLTVQSLGAVRAQPRIPSVLSKIFSTTIYSRK